MLQPQLIEDFLVLFIERRPLAAIHQVPEQEQLPKMRPSRLDQAVVENRGEIERSLLCQKRSMLYIIICCCSTLTVEDRAISSP